MANDASPGRQRGRLALLRDAFQVADAVREPATARAVAVGTGLPVRTVYRILGTLVELGIITRHHAPGRGPGRPRAIYAATAPGGTPASGPAPGPNPCRLVVLRPDWLVRLETEARLRWEGSARTREGDVVLVGVTRTGAEECQLADDDPRLDAIHSLWRARKTGRRLVEYERLLLLTRAVARQELVAAGLLRNWPRNPVYGRFFRDRKARALATCLGALNRSQRQQIRAAVTGS